MRRVQEPRSQKAPSKAASILPEMLPSDLSLSAALSCLTLRLNGMGAGTFRMQTACAIPRPLQAVGSSLACSSLRLVAGFGQTEELSHGFSSMAGSTSQVLLEVGP